MCHYVLTILCLCTWNKGSACDLSSKVVCSNSRWKMTSMHHGTPMHRKTQERYRHFRYTKKRVPHYGTGGHYLPKIPTSYTFDVLKFFFTLLSWGVVCCFIYRIRTAYLFYSWSLLMKLWHLIYCLWGCSKLKAKFKHYVHKIAMRLIQSKKRHHSFTKPNLKLEFYWKRSASMLSSFGAIRAWMRFNSTLSKFSSQMKMF